MGLIENQFCNLVYGHRLSKNFSVYEEMLSVGDFSTGKAICHVSEVISLLPWPVLRASVSMVEGCVASTLFVETPGTFCFVPLPMFPGSISW